MLVVILGVPLMAAAILWLLCRLPTLIRSAATDWGSWHCSLTSALIDADDQHLTNAQPEWPLKGVRWPSPVTDTGHMPPVRSRAYARAAASRASSLRFQAEAWVLLGAALLGWRIPIFFTQTITVNAASSRNQYILESLGQTLPLTAAILMVAMGLILRRRSDDYDTAQHYYVQTAEATIMQKKLLPLSSPPQKPMWRKILYNLIGRSPESI